MMSNRMRSSALKVPGARIYSEARGNGPLLLMIPGGPTDAGIFAPLADRLADEFTTVAYDPRGNSRSTFDGRPVDQDMDVHGDDAARLIESYDRGPAFVLGNSGGAQIGLNLAARHPSKVHTLVAHEPPCLRLLPDAEAEIAGIEEIERIYRSEGAGMAMMKFWQNAGVEGPPQPEAPPSPEEMELFGRIGGNLDYFFGHGLRPLSLYAPDVEALRSGRVRVVVGVGATSAGQLAHRTALALAAELGTEPAVFPGDHTGFGPHPDAFAAKLRLVLG